MDKKDKQAGVRHLLTALTFLCIAMILLAAFKLINIAPVREGVGLFIVPLQNGINAAGSILADREVDRRTAGELAEENRHLEEQVKALESQNLHLTEDHDRLEELEALYALDQQYFEYDTVAAQVIAKEPGRWYNTFTINRGTASGITVDMNVLCQEGLAGIVTETGRNWAKVRAIADDSSKISAMLLPTGDNCIISGDLTLLEEGQLIMSELKTDYNVVTGTKIVTSQISDKYLPGLLIGYVDTIEQDPNHLTSNGRIIPAVDFSHIRSVLVILHTKQDTDLPDAAKSSAGSEKAASDSGNTSSENGSSAKNDSSAEEVSSAESTENEGNTGADTSAADNAAPAEGAQEDAAGAEPGSENTVLADTAPENTTPDSAAPENTTPDSEASENTAPADGAAETGNAETAEGV